MNNKAINEFGFPRISRRVLSAEVDVTLLDLLNSSYTTKPNSLIANYYSSWSRVRLGP